MRRPAVALQVVLLAVVALVFAGAGYAEPCPRAADQGRHCMAADGSKLQGWAPDRFGKSLGTCPPGRCATSAESARGLRPGRLCGGNARTLTG